MTDYYNPQKEQREKLIQNIDRGFRYFLMNPNLNVEIRPDIKKIYAMQQKLIRMIEIEK